MLGLRTAGRGPWPCLPPFAFSAERAEWDTLVVSIFFLSRSWSSLPESIHALDAVAMAM